MKKLLALTLIILTLFVVSGCDITPPPENGTQDPVQGDVQLPDLEERVKHEIEAILGELDITFGFFEMQETRERSQQFIHYGNFRQAGEYVDYGTHVTVIISQEFFDPTVYFTPQDILYDGPNLDASFFSLPLYVYDDDEGLYKGGGGAFSVGLVWNYCIDGDTSRFDYPSDVYDKITSGAKSTRYLNIDTPETWGGGEEEWGKLATEYVCDLLEEAESIVLQTDPGDNLLGTYGRLLAWVWIKLPGEEAYFLLNYMVVRQGLGEVAYLFGAGETDVTMYDGKTYTDWMWQAETLAEADGYGMHGALLDWYWDYENDRPHPVRWN